MLNYKNNLDKLLHYDCERVLTETCQRVSLPLDAEDQTVMENMIQYIKWSRDPELNKGRAKHTAVGIAANQMGHSKTMFYIRFNYLQDKKKVEVELAMINPKILTRSQLMAFLSKGEGCLSVKDNKKHPGIVPRNYKIEIEAYDFLASKYVKLTLRGYEAIVFQHEYNHLNGKLYHNFINQNDIWHTNPDWIKI